MDKSEEVRYGCHCDLDPDAQPDGCVLDYGVPDDCIYAPALVAARKGREACDYWKPVAVDVNCDKSKATGYINTNAHLEAKVALLEHDLAEQCRLLGMGSEREARLMTQLAESQAREAKLCKLIHDGCLSIAQYGEQPPQPLLDAIAMQTDTSALREMIEAAKAEEQSRIIQLLAGIGQTEVESEIGWWETSTGAEFGAGILAKIQARKS